jgi:hypothetical protein
LANLLSEKDPIPPLLYLQSNTSHAVANTAYIFPGSSAEFQKEAWSNMLHAVRCAGDIVLEVPLCVQRHWKEKKKCDKLETS